jgi:hypothetical protein
VSTGSWRCGVFGASASGRRRKPWRALELAGVEFIDENGGGAGDFLAFAYSAAAKSQTEYDYFLASSIIQNFDNLSFQPENVLIFDGTQPKAPVLENSKYIKLIDRLVQLHINNQWTWGYFFMQHQGFADGFEGCEPLQGLETLGEVVGVEERYEVLAKLVVTVLVIAAGSRLLEGAVHSLDRSVRPRVVWLALNAPIKHHATRVRKIDRGL